MTNETGVAPPNKGNKGAPVRVPDVSRLPCPKAPEGMAHHIQPFPVGRGEDYEYRCVYCGRSWVDLDADVRARTGGARTGGRG